MWRDEVTPQDWTALAAHLAEHGLALDPSVPPRQYSGGLANLNYQVVVNGEPVVLRRPPAGPLAAGANDMAREHKVMSALHPALPVVPRPIHLCEDPSVLGAPFQLIEHREGIAIGWQMPTGASVPDLARSLLTTMAQLHALDPAAIGLGDLGKPAGFLDRQVRGWGKRAADVYPSGLPSSLQAVLDHLAAHPFGESDHVSVLHCDLKPDNLLVDPSSLAPVAVIDWDMGTRGDPLFDLAVLLSYWVQSDDPAELHGLQQVPSLAPGAPPRAWLAETYFALARRTPVDLGPLLVLARLRLAVAWVQLYRQWERGTVTDPKYAAFEKIALAMLEWTADTLSDPPV
jgi:aminoglycoside phosphotransferase (APT) family kinase protein